MEQHEFDNKVSVKVMFRVWRKGNTDVIALFPEVPSDDWGANCMSYEHVGQHGAAHIEHVVSLTRPATPHEYYLLRRELESIGYVLTVVSKQPHNAYQTRTAH